MKKCILLTFLFLTISVHSVISQPLQQQPIQHQPVERDDPTLAPRSERDSVEYKYEFFKGDTLYYTTDNRDSIIINYNPALTKMRNEKFSLWCDSTARVILKPDTIYNDATKKEIKKVKVDTVRLMFMTMMFTELKTKEKILNKDTISNRDSSPWLNKKNHIIIDSTGRRYEIYSEMNTATMSPGGPFTPEFLPNFGGGKRFENATWLQKDTIYMVENAIPAPIAFATSLWRAQNNLDTLGHSCISLRYARTATATYYVDSKSTFIHITGVLNNGLQMRLDQEDYIPVHVYSTMEQKLIQHEKESDKTTPVWHYLTIDYLLDKFVPSPERLAVKKAKKQAIENAKTDMDTKPLD